MGRVGAGQTTKLANRITSGCTMAVVAEAVNLAKRSGVGYTRSREALAGSFADPFQLLAPRMAAEDFADPPGTVAMTRKDPDPVARAGADAVPPMSGAARACGKAASRAARIGISRPSW
ncbi:MAG: NAD-binding protein [Rhodosalinus sp.]